LELDVLQIGWILGFVPDAVFVWVYYILLTAGLGLYAVSKLVVWLPLIGQYKLPVELFGIVLLMTGAYFYGGHGVQLAWQARVAELEARVKIAQEQSQQVNTVIQEKIVTKVKVIKENVYVNREIIREVAGAQLDATCTLPRSSVVLHDSASRNQVAERAAATDGTPSGVEAHRLLEAVVENYGACHENAAKLKAWQDWYSEQKKIFETVQR
jgi:hypothetical protein